MLSHLGVKGTPWPSSYGDYWEWWDNGGFNASIRDTYLFSALLGNWREPDNCLTHIEPDEAIEDAMSHSPFPGMDPYLEASTIWPDVHTTLMSIFREQLTPLLAPKYLAELETQVVIDRVDDDPQI